MFICPPEMCSKARSAPFLLFLALFLVQLSGQRAVEGVPSDFSLPSVRSLQSEVDALNRSQVATLLDLRGLLGIRSKYWPRKTDPCVVWVGITCENGQVVSIALTGLRRTAKGRQHPAFAIEPLQNLTFLRSFNSSGFALPGSIPEWIGGLSGLQQLDLSFSSIVSILPSSMGSLSNLRTLFMSGNNISGNIPSSFGSLINLTSLDLSSNNLTGSIPESLTSLHNLDYLDLSSNFFAGQIPLGIGNLSSLQTLVLNSNELNGSIPVELGKAASLRILDLSSNAMSGPIPASLGNLINLLSLKLSRNSLSGGIPVELSNCTALQVLYLDGNVLNGTVPSSLGLLQNVSILNLSVNNLTGPLPSDFLASTKAQQILLSDNQFYGYILSINSLYVKQLDLSRNYFQGTVPVPFISGAVLDSNCLMDVPNQRGTDVCMEFYGRIQLPFGLSPVASPSPAPSSFDKRHLVAILTGAFGGLIFALLVLCIVYILLRPKRSKKDEDKDLTGGSRRGALPPVSGNLSVNLLSLGENFSYDQLLLATNNFSESNSLKAGHSGHLFRGTLENGLVIVVKRIELEKYKKDSYLAELEFFGKASHTRLVPLLGHCFERDDEKLLVYKYMPGRDIGYALHRKINEDAPEGTLPSLDWITRLKIAIGAAEGLTYLHNECTPPLVHRDIQSSSILLDDKFEVRLGSLSEACTAVGEPYQGVISRILRRSQTSDYGDKGATSPTCAYDIYCFGKVLLELVSGKLGISGSTDPSTDAWLDWALGFISTYDKEGISKIIDPKLIVDEDLMEEVWAMSIIAKSCLNPKPSKRPPMKYVLKALENPLNIVRDDRLNGSGRSQGSSHGSWNAARFGSWRHSSSETVVIPGSLREEYLQQKGTTKQLTNGGSQGSGGQGEVSQRRPGSSEIFPEPIEESVAPATTMNAKSDKQDT
ncbi:hypothetical protein KP509_12G010100 [Ceratopteris richardii]|uniref:Protein kinase domain-containing protein n=1 Tax=Ceratopteris richardii TaxID=49495 RepID=A0A8T2TIZ1_CERRI|nr:hypothetical protein KP509_12G010100 [Ceratopteris richardii]KAH7422468.1 hypothetical protein KP509_12G010100 [Ceratopteris richardii]